MEKKERLGQEPAFAALAIDKSIKSDEQTTEHSLNGNNGMSKRFYAACAAMQGILSNQQWAESMKIKDDWDEFKNRVISGSFEIADELLRQENE